MIIPHLEDERTPSHGEITVLTADAAPHIRAVILPHATAAYLAERADQLTQAAWVVSRMVPSHQSERGRILAEHLAMLTASLHMLSDLAICDAATLAAQLGATSTSATSGATSGAASGDASGPQRSARRTRTPRPRTPRAATGDTLPTSEHEGSDAA